MEDFAKFSALALDGMPLEASEVEKARTAFETELAIRNVRFRDLPDEVKDVPADTLVQLEHHSVYAGKSAARTVDDPSSEIGKAYRRLPQPNENAAPFACILKDADGTRRSDFTLNPPADGTYRWYKLGRGRLGRGSRIFFSADKYISFRLGAHYIECDGLGADPNVCDIWVSASAGTATASSGGRSSRRTPTSIRTSSRTTSGGCSGNGCASAAIRRQSSSGGSRTRA